MLRVAGATGGVMRRASLGGFAALSVGLASLCLSACSGSAPQGAAPPHVPSPAAGAVGPFTARGGPFLEDRYGRVVLMHGVDLVYKEAPFEVVVSGKGPNVLTDAEAARMAGLGFDVVRLGIIWKGLEPGTLGIDSPSVCTEGSPRPNGAGQFDQATFESYLQRLDATIALLAKYGVYSLIDMHQDVYSNVFGGEGAPDWAVCTDGVTPRPKLNVPDWSVNLQGPGVGTAYAHFWRNDVVGNLQGEFDSVWTKVAAHFRGNPWVVGYDPFNEPWDESLPPTAPSSVFDAELQCFYTGRSDPGVNQAGQAISCPPDDPSVGLIPRIEAADPGHLVFYEGDFETDSGVPNNIGPMPFPRLVANFHDYCFLHVPNGPEPPDFGSVCAPFENDVFDGWSKDRSNDSTSEQPAGPAWFLTEFGASTDTADLARITSDADAHLVGWMYWQWINYDDPTGSHSSALWPPRAATPSQFAVLSQTYAQAIAGTPTSMTFDQSSAAFSLSYAPNATVTEPTVIFVPLSEHYQRGYCAKVTGGRVTSLPGAEHLDVVNAPGATEVQVSVTSGHC